MLKWMAASTVQPSAQEREKAPEVSVDGEALKEWTEHCNSRVSSGESALGDPKLTKKLLEVALLLIYWENKRSRSVSDMFSSFYLVILGISRYSIFHLPFFYLFFLFSFF